MLIKLVTDVVKDAFAECNYASEYGLVTLSNRPDLCQFQCNGAMVAAKKYKRAPMDIATEITDLLKENPDFKDITCVKPVFYQRYK